MSNDGLAPVTYLFGARSADEAQTGARPSRSSSRPSSLDPTPPRAEMPMRPARRTEAQSRASHPTSRFTAPPPGESWFVEDDAEAADDSESPEPSSSFGGASWRTSGAHEIKAPDEDARAVEPPGDVDRAVEPPSVDRAVEPTLTVTSSPSFPRFIENPEIPANESPVAKPDKSARRASNVSMNALARRGVSKREMIALLEKRELEPEEVEAEIARLKSAGLIDDFELAENLVRTLVERKKLGRSAVTSELRRRKIDETAILAALEVLDDDDDELTRAIEVATKRAGQLSSYDRETAQRRLGAFLQRRGYSGSVMSAAMKAALDGHGSSSSGPRFR